MSKQKVIGIIPARYSSKRLPGKALADIHGKPLIQWTFENAKKCQALDDLYVATDDQRIFDRVEKFGGKAIYTSNTCKTGTDRLAEALEKEEFLQTADIIVNIQGDEPCLESEVIQSVVDLLLSDPSADMATAIVKITSIEEVTDPHVVKCVVDCQHNALYFSRSPIPSKIESEHYKHLGIYAYRENFLLHYAELTQTPLQQAEDLEQLKVLEHGFKIKAAVVESQSIGVDTPEDLTKVRKRLCTQNTSSSQAESAPH